MEQEIPIPASSASSQVMQIVMISILIASLVAGGGVYVYQHSQLTKSQQNLQTQIDSLNSQLITARQVVATSSSVATSMPIATPTMTSTPDVTAGWQTYNDVSTGMFVKYPSTWTAEKTSTSINFRSPESVSAVKRNMQDFQADVVMVNYTPSAKALPNEQGKPSNSSTLESWLASQKGTPRVQSYVSSTMPLVNYGMYPVFAVVNAYPSTTYYVEINGQVLTFKAQTDVLTTIDKNILQSVKVSR